MSRSSDPNVKIARLQKESLERQQLIDAGKAALSNPLIVGLSALVANRLLYTNGFYDLRRDKDGRVIEKDTSILGGPVWWQLGSSLPQDQENYQKTNALIVTATVAIAAAPAVKSLAPAFSGGLRSVTDALAAGV